MLDDYNSDNGNEENKASTSDNKFIINEFKLGDEQNKETIISMTTSKKFIFFLTQSHNLFCVNSSTMESINELYTLPTPKEKYNFKEKNFNKIWVDREGNHCIIRTNNAIYYFNSELKLYVELENFRGKEICAVALDDRNTDTKNTQNFLAVDYDNRIYECSIEIVQDEMSRTQKVQDQIELLTQIPIYDPFSEEDDESDRKKSKPIDDRIYGLRFFHATNQTIDQNSDSCYIIAVTRNRLYQFIGPGLKSFKQIFKRYENNPSLIEDACKHFPRKDIYFNVDFDILFKNESRSIGDQKSKKMDVFNHFGWRTDSGYCFGEFEHTNSDKSSGLPMEIKNFNVIPFQKITDKGKKEIKNLEPISIKHTINHIFILYDDCLTVVSKLTYNIINTIYFDTKYNLMIFNELFEKNGILLLSKEKGVDQINLKEENDEIWKDYLDIGNFPKAINFCNPDSIKKKISRIDAEKKFKDNRLVAANAFAMSDEKFEVVCLKYLKERDLEALKTYLEIYREMNFKQEEGKDLPKEQLLQLNLIVTWMIEIFLTNKKTNLREFNTLIKQNKKNVDSSLLYQILLNYGKTDEYVAFSQILNDYRRVVIYYINQGKIGAAINSLSELAGYLIDDAKGNMDDLKLLGNIFLEFSHLFFHFSVKDSFYFLYDILIKNKINIDKIIETAILALMSRADKDIIRAKLRNELSEKERNEFDSDVTCILKYLGKLEKASGCFEKEAKAQKNNINNLYLFYLALNPINKQAIIDYLKEYLILDSNGRRKKTAHFQFDYAKTVLKENKQAYALVLALMGKYMESISYILNEDPNDTEETLKKNQEMAEFIATNALDKKIQKSLWIEIFRIQEKRKETKKSGDDNNEEKFSKAINVMEKSKVLKIEDVLPYITDSIKIGEFKTHISKCISQYEKNINHLKENIKSYNNTAENIKMDINKIKKKPMEIKYNEFKCEICKESIRDRRIFLFPCGHMFDRNCIRQKLLDYEKTGLEYLHDDNVKIDKIFYDLGYIVRPEFKENLGLLNLGEPKKVEEPEKKKKGGFFNNILKSDTFNSLGGLMSGLKKEDAQKIKYDKEQQYSSVLNELLNKHCVLCGNFLVDSVQLFSLKNNSETEPDFNL